MVLPSADGAMNDEQIRHDWTDGQVRAIYELALMELVYRAQTVHRQFHDPGRVQLATLLSVQTGGCSEDCGYCAQSARTRTGQSTSKLLEVEEVVAAAGRAKQAGSSRFCMGAAWRAVRDGDKFERVLDMVRRVSAVGIEVCVTLGMITEEQAHALAAAGLTSYNHNLDTGPEFYRSVVSTHTYEDRLRTIENVRRAGLRLCCGGIIGMGERIDDRVGLLRTLACLDEHPESVPINALVRIAGTPMQHLPSVDPLDMVRTIATARMVMPRSRVRLSAGRSEMSREAQALCFLAGANSIFVGDRLLTTANCSVDEDRDLLVKLGLSPLGAA